MWQVLTVNQSPGSVEEHALLGYLLGTAIRLIPVRLDQGFVFTAALLGRQNKNIQRFDDRGETCVLEPTCVVKCVYLRDGAGGSTVPILFTADCQWMKSEVEEREREEGLTTSWGC